MFSLPANRVPKLVWPLVMVMTLLAAGVACCDEIWTGIEDEAYVSWLQAVAAADSTVGEDPLYPTGYAGGDPAGLALSLLDIAKSTRELEGALARSRKPAAGYEPGLAVALARNYRHLTEYDKALGLYRGTLAVMPDTGLAAEAFTTAVLHGDSLQVTRELLNIIGSSGLDVRAKEVELGYRTLLSRGADHDLDLLMQKVDGQDSPMPLRIRFWHAFAQHHLEHYAAALYHLRLLICSAPVLDELPAAAGAWVAGAIPDLLQRVGRVDAAAELYTLLAADGPDECRPWGRFQLGNIHFQRGDYVGAADCFEQIVAEADSNCGELWLQRVRALAATTAKLDRIRNEGESYGIADLHSR